MNETHQLVVYADNVNILGGIIDTVQENKEDLLQANREVSLEVNTEAIKTMAMSHHQNEAQNHNLLIPKKPFKNVASSSIWEQH
jgi:preprotein translocase subunit YajC